MLALSRAPFARKLKRTNNARNAPRILAPITSRNDRHVWTDRNSFTGMSTEMIKNAVFFVFLSKKYT